MALIYVHIPFCKKKCFYCDFYSIPNLKLIDDYIDALVKEIEEKRNFFNYKKLKYSTIYFGGGTPSLLSEQQLGKILNAIFSNYEFSSNIEQSIELNPDDITIDYLQSLKKLGFNRLSIGVQSLNDKTLKYLNRRHDSENAQKVIEEASSLGFDNISADYIFGLENQTIEQVEFEMEKLLKLPIQHLSAYNLELDNNSVFHKLLISDKVKELDENISFLQYKKIIEIARKHKFYQYEISNFAQKSFESKHNSSYWKLIPYLGLGASAHSYYQKKRSWNFADIHKYFQQIQEGRYYEEIENLSEKESFNEYIMLSLRTKKGIDKKKLVTYNELYVDEFYNRLKSIKSNYYIENTSFIKITEEAFFVSDDIIFRLFI